MRPSPHVPLLDRLPTRAITLALGLGAALLPPRPAAAERPDTPGNSELYAFDESDVVEHFDSPGGRFRIHFTRAGRNAVPLADGDASGVPDHVEDVAEFYDDSLRFYVDELGYREPLPDGDEKHDGGDDRFDVYLVDFARRADGNFARDTCVETTRGGAHCVGYIVQENDFATYGYPSVRYANRLLASHELFHAVTAAYDASQSATLTEGSAVWASSAWDPSLRDVEHFAAGFLERTSRSLDQPLPGAADAFSYGVSLFFQFLGERYDADLVRTLWEETEGAPWLASLATVLERDYGSSFAEALREFSIWNLHTGSRATADYYADGESYPELLPTEVALPYASPVLRAFYASTQYFRAAPEERTHVTAALLSGEGLELVVALRRGRAITVASELPVAVGDADEVIVAIVNPATSGTSVRPQLCFGAPDEVSACLGSPMPDAGPDEDDAGLGMPDAGVGTVDGGTIDEGVAGGSCDCSTTRPRSGQGGLVALGLVALGVLRRRTRRQATGRA